MAYSGPTKQDFITQVEGDLAAETESTDVLEARLAAVQEAESDEAAYDAYHQSVKEAQNARRSGAN